MASAAVAGFKGVMLFSTSTGGSVTKAAEIMDWTINVEHAEIDVTSHDSSGTREIISGIDQWSGSAEMLHVMTSGGPGSANAIFDVMTSKTKVDMEFYPTGSSQDGWYEGTAFFTGYEITAPIEGALATNLTFTGALPLTRQST